MKINVRSSWISSYKILKCSFQSVFILKKEEKEKEKEKIENRNKWAESYIGNVLLNIWHGFASGSSVSV